MKTVLELTETLTNCKHPTNCVYKQNTSPRFLEHPTNIKPDQAFLKLSGEIEWPDKVR